ncbi:MAG: ArnT family glycosyltransferase [Bryobacteraceae bacterium]
MRHRAFSDGVSYLAIARYYVAGDWHAALNSYWSPLYSWFLAALMIILRPSSYWEAALIHLANLLAYFAALVGFELFLGRLIQFQQRLTEGDGISEQTIRIAGYSTFLISTLLLIGIGYNSPDMVATAIGVFLAWLLLKVEAESARAWDYVLFGCLLGLGYLSRAAFAIFIPLYILFAAGLLRRSGKRNVLTPVLYSGIAALLISAPFVIALSVSKGRFTIGDAGKLNYGWEIAGAARSVHWQGEPYDIGKPIHPTHKVLDHPATYTFASPVPGSYPPWYEPAYWYEGIKPHLKLGPQLAVLGGSCKTLVFLFLTSPISMPVIVLGYLMGWRRWLSRRGLLAYWFLLLPAAAYIGTFMVVYLDKRYVAGSLLVLWLCLLASIRVDRPSLRAKANVAVQVLGVVFALGYLVGKLGAPTAYALDDLVHHRESEYNLNWMIAEGMKNAGLRPGDRIAWIGQSIDAEWASIDRVTIVAEVPVVWDRKEGLFRKVSANEKEIETFWSSSPEVKAKVFDAFRKEGAAFVIVDKIPSGVDQTGWHRLFPKGTPHLPWTGAQFDNWKTMAYYRLDPSRRQ